MDTVQELLLKNMTEAYEGSIKQRAYTAVVCLLKDAYKAVNGDSIDDGVLTDWAYNIANQVTKGID